MRRGPWLRRTTAPAASVCLASVLSGCGGGDASSTAAPPSDPSPSASASPPSVEPASGRRISLAVLSARTIDGYDYDHSLAKEIVFSSSRDLGQDLAFSDVTVYPGTSNARAARLTVKNSSWKHRPHAASPVTIDGEQWYHLTGPIGEGKHLDDFGIVYDSRLVRVSFELTAAAPKRARIVASVLATVDLE